MADDLDLTALRAVAQVADTGDRWHDDGCNVVVVGKNERIALISTTAGRQVANGAHVARFDPPTATALLDVVEKAWHNEYSTESSAGVQLRAALKHLAQVVNERSPDE